MGDEILLPSTGQAASRDGEAVPRKNAVRRLWWKRPFDLAVASGMLLLTGPLVGALALAIRLANGGPAFYSQERIGMHGRPFRIWKLRTMHANNDEKAHRNAAANWFTGHDNGNGFKSLEDPRITRLGRILRRTSLDELPQLINVLRGEMSMVGPRPAIPYEINFYEPQYFRRQEVPPGITGLWQASGRDRLSAQSMMALDLNYVERASLALDLKILMKTGPAVISAALRAR
jgi:lipopolysaccharide/colanic/teichoic acid biosynthesis glycosyltransferase